MRNKGDSQKKKKWLGGVEHSLSKDPLVTQPKARIPKVSPTVNHLERGEAEWRPEDQNEENRGTCSHK